jgi:Zn-dependent alcohol dehydrogenase
VRDVEVADPGPGEVRIETMFSGISAGTEMNVYSGRAPQWGMHRDPATKLFSRTDRPD